MNLIKLARITFVDSWFPYTFFAVYVIILVTGAFYNGGLVYGLLAIAVIAPIVVGVAIADMRRTAQVYDA